MYLFNITVISVLPTLISAAEYTEYQFRTYIEKQFNKNAILLMQKMFLCLTKSYGLTLKKRDRVPGFVFAFLNIILEEERKPLRL
jgi:hypothetical protein